MGASKAAIATREDREAWASAKGWPDNVEWDALDRPKRRTMAGTAGDLWSLAICVCPFCQMVG